MKQALLAIVSLSAMITACSDSDSSNPPTSGIAAETPAAQSPDTTPDSTPGTTSSSARFRLTFNGSWSEQTHPVLFPGSSAHFSRLSGAVHNEQVIFWEPGQIATDGIEFMAETGGTSLLRSEVNSAISAGSALSFVEGGGITTSPGSVSVEFEVTRDYPEISMVSMIAPSPDWFVGVHNLSLIEGDGFVSSMTVDLVAYDSGTDSGGRYTSPDADTQPRDPVARVSSEPSDTSFVDGMPFAGQFLIERL